MTVFQVQNLVEVFSDMEAQAAAVGRGELIGILALEYPAFVRSGEFQLITVKPGLFRGDSWLNFRHLQMSDADKLVVDLLPFGFQLHLIRQRLPSAASADPEMLAERLQPVL